MRSSNWDSESTPKPMGVILPVKGWARKMAGTWVTFRVVFVDVMKELPATLVMRPFNFDTLATQTYTLAADERLAEASLAALAIVGVGLLPIYALARQIARGRAVAGC